MKTKLTLSRVSGIFLFTSLVFSACERYEEGPDISLTPRSERVANTWTITRAVENNQDVTHQYNRYELYLTQEGAAELDADYTLLGVDYTFVTQGTWHFTDGENNLLLDFEEDSQDAEYVILKLTEDEMWLRKVGEGTELYLGEK